MTSTAILQWLCTPEQHPRVDELLLKGVCVVFSAFQGVDVVVLPAAVVLFAVQVVVRRSLICIEELTNEL